MTAVASGMAAGAGVSMAVGGMGLAGGFGAVGIGMAPMVGAGGLAGAAAYGAFRAIAEGDKTAIGAFSLGAFGGMGVSAAVGGMGLAGGFGAVRVGMATMGLAGGVVGLGLYGVAKMLDSGYREPIDQLFNRMEEKIAWQEAYTQALIEVFLPDDLWFDKFAALEIDSELDRLKQECSRKQLLEPAATTHKEVLHSSSSTSKLPQLVYTIAHHSAKIQAIALSPDGHTIATGSDDGEICLWNLPTGNHDYTFHLPRPVRALAFSPTGQTLVGGGFDRVITRWQLETRQMVGSLLRRGTPTSHDGSIQALAVSANGQMVVSGSADKTIRLWSNDSRSFITDRLRKTVSGHTDAVTAIVLNEGRCIVSGSADSTVRIWPLDRQELPRVLTGHTGGVSAIALSPNQQTIASGSLDSTIRLWDVETGNLQGVLHHTAPVKTVAFGADGTRLVSSSEDGAVHYWRLVNGENGKLIGERVLSIQIPNHEIIATSNDGTTFITTHPYGKISVWKMNSYLSDLLVAQK